MRLLLLLLAGMLVCNIAQSQGNRSINGSGNNLNHTDMGMAHAPLRRITSLSYGGNGFSDPGGVNRPNPREISNEVFNQTDFIADVQDLSDFVWGFGQFIDHDITFNLDTINEFIEIPIPAGDEFFDPQNTGTRRIMMRRGDFDRSTGSEIDNPRQQVNAITSWIDGSGVYGSDNERALWLRTGVDGKLKTSSGNLLPFNTTTGEFDAPIDAESPHMVVEGHPAPERYFVAGDIRANEQPGLIAFHTLFVREHNRLCDELKEENPAWEDEQLYQRARKMVGALIQAVLYEEWLPALGIRLPAYNGYRSETDATISSIFSAAAFRIGHTMVNEQLIRLDEHKDTLSFGSVHIKEAFFKPLVIKDEGGIEPFFRGMITQKQQKFDNKVVSTLRNFLFGQPGDGGLDLVALNIERARERGLPDYNTVREAFGLGRKTSFDQITNDAATASSLSNIYREIDDLDPWVGMLSEEPDAPSIAGESMTAILAAQFTELRDGDRFWFENDPAFSREEIARLKLTRLSDIILRNTSIADFPADVFHVEGTSVTVGVVPFKSIRQLELKAYPNPVARHLNLFIKSWRSEAAVIKIIDGAGREVFASALNIQPGDNHFNFDLAHNLLQGVYVIAIESTAGNSSIRILKQ